MRNRLPSEMSTWGSEKALRWLKAGVNPARNQSTCTAPGKWKRAMPSSPAVWL